ncbi:hypothetical protein DNTS_020723, partial [Danionella cerebrum]
KSWLVIGGARAPESLLSPVQLLLRMKYQMRVDHECRDSEASTELPASLSVSISTINSSRKRKLSLSGN